MLKLSARVLGILLLATTAHADPTEPLQSFYPEFLKTEITPAHWQYESPISPAKYEADHGDFLAEFTSPSGKRVRLVVKAPVTTTQYDVPPIGKGQTAYDYLNEALYDASGNPRTATYIKLPKSTYNIEFPLNSACSHNYVHWQLPSGASDLVIDGQGSTVNFSDFCLGLNLPNVDRVTFTRRTATRAFLPWITLSARACAGRASLPPISPLPQGRAI